MTTPAGPFDGFIAGLDRWAKRDALLDDMAAWMGNRAADYDNTTISERKDLLAFVDRYNQLDRERTKS